MFTTGTMKYQEHSSIQVKTYTTIEGINSQLWDSLVTEEDLFSTYRFLQAVEKSHFEGYRFWYLVFFQMEKPVASAILFSTTLPADLLTGGTLGSLLKGIRKVFKSFLTFRLLVCGVPVSLGKNNIRFAPGVDKSMILDLLRKKMTEIANANGLKILALKEFNQQEIIQLGGIRSFGFIRADSLPTNYLDISWDTYHEYLGALRHRYRQSLLRSQKKINRREISIRIHQDFGMIYSQKTYRLYENVIKRAKYKMEILPLQFFLNINQFLEPESELIVFTRHQEPIGQILMLYSSNTAAATFLGLDYNYNSEYDLYFNMLARIIKRAIEKKKKLLDFGQNSYHAKGRMGARTEPLYIYIKHLNGVWNYFIQCFSRLLFPRMEIPAHHVFNRVLADKEKQR